MKPLKSIECLTLDTPSFAQGNRVDERVRARCRYCCSVSPTTIPIAPTGVPDGSRVCSSSHGSLGCFHIIQPIRWAGFGSLIINVDSIQSIFRHFSTTSTTRRYICSKATTRARAVGYAPHPGSTHFHFERFHNFLESLSIRICPIVRLVSNEYTPHVTIATRGGTRDESQSKGWAAQ